MGTYTEGYIVKAVRKALDENTDTTALTAEENTLELGDIIKAQIPNGINAVRAVAPLSKLDVNHVAFGSEGNPVSTFTLPEDFLRLAVIYGSTWKTSISEFVVPGTTGYLMQSSEFAGIKGSSSRPVAALTMGMGSDALKMVKTVELYPKTSGLFSYVPAVTETEPVGAGTGADDGTDGDASGTVAAERSFNIEALIYPAVIFMIAAHVCGVQMNTNGVQVLRSLAMSQLGMQEQK